MNPNYFRNPNRLHESVFPVLEIVCNHSVRMVIKDTTISGVIVHDCPPVTWYSV